MVHEWQILLETKFDLFRKNIVDCNTSFYVKIFALFWKKKSAKNGQFTKFLASRFTLGHGLNACFRQNQKFSKLLIFFFLIIVKMRILLNY